MSSRGHCGVREVVVIGDVLRPDARGQVGGTDRPTQWLYHAVHRLIGLASGLPVTLLTPTRCRPLADWLVAQRPPDQADMWWAAMHAELRADLTPDLLLDALLGRFCVTYEAPPWLTTLLDQLRVPWLDIRLHPVRFLDDLIFAVLSPNAETQADVLELALPESHVVATAGLREAMALLITESNLPDGTLLVLGQRPFDATQIIAGGFFDAGPQRAEIDAICRAHRAVLLKPHPSGEAHTLLLAAAASRANVLGATGDNIYRLLALPQISAVLTVNSSAAVEAAYFGKRVHSLAPPAIRLAWHGADDDASGHAALDTVLLCPDFWRIVLAPHARVTARDGMRLPAKPNRLRIALDSFWNFNEIDTDRIPRGAAPPVLAEPARAA
jgi:hypothetical protein